VNVRRKSLENTGKTMLNTSLNVSEVDDINGLDELENQKTESINTKIPFHLSICVTNLESTRNFYTNLLGLSERRSTKSSAHFDFYGCQIAFHEVPDYSAHSFKREVDGEDVPVPHFGVILSSEEFKKVEDRLTKNNVHFIRKPGFRFTNQAHEQYVMFLEDPSGHNIEIKYFTKAPVGDWA